MLTWYNEIFQIFPPILAAPVPTDVTGGTWSGLIFYVGIALGVSFLCSIFEAILLSTSHSYVETEIENNDSRAARLMQRHKADVERPISAILTLNTVAHTVGAAGAGAEAVGIFGNEFFGLISAVLTILILVFSEIIPKTLGATYWKELNGFAAYGIQFLVWSLFPAVWILEKTTQLLKSDDVQPTISRSELETMARIGASEGALLEREDKILRNLFHLSRVQVKDVMTPRTVVASFQEGLTVQEVVENNPSLPFSRLPIYKESMDDISGFVLRYEIYHAYANGEQNKPISELKREIGVVPETNSVASVLDEFINKQQHILLVIDEFGGTAGIMTMEDALETLLGIEITDESDTVADLRKLAEQRYERQQRLLERLNTIARRTTETPQPPSIDPTPAPEGTD